MSELNAYQIDLLREACNHPLGEVRAKVVGKIHLPRAEARRVESAKALQLFGYFTAMPQDGAYLVWRIKPALLPKVREVLAGG